VNRKLALRAAFGSRFRFQLFAVYCLLYASSAMNLPLNMHAARSALNQDPELRQWAEAWLKDKERATNQMMTDQEFEKHWLYVRPERMHEGAMEAVTAYASAAQKE
jgi:hypothetical protein